LLEMQKRREQEGDEKEDDQPKTAGSVKMSLA
jgi:hypothetical protein